MVIFKDKCQLSLILIQALVPEQLWSKYVVKISFQHDSPVDQPLLDMAEVISQTKHDVFLSVMHTGINHSCKT